MCTDAGGRRRLIERALFDDAAAVHHEDAIGDVGDNAEVVGHEDDSVPLVAQLAQLLEDLRLDRHVQRGRRLVGDQQARRAESAIAIITRWRMPPENSCG